MPNLNQTVHTILVIDDEKPIREALDGILSDEGFHPLTAASAEEGLELLDQKENIHLVLLDIWMPGMDGLEALKLIKEHHDIPVIMISGHGTIDTAVQATRDGAFDFIEKPLSYDKIILTIHKGLHVSQLEQENKLLRESHENRKGLTEITGQSPPIQHLRTIIERVAPTDAWVLIRGEHGTGKELVAQTIHRKSSRGKRPMVEVNCAAIPEELIESELFGYEKGAFTGAGSRKKGKFDQANGSTLFLDEIGDMSLKSQAKVLRILQEKKFERVGGSTTIAADVRVLAATNKDLEQEIAEGTFRADLFYRLNVVPIVVPKLAERLEDIPLLVEFFLYKFSNKGLGKKQLSSHAMELLMRHTWPGNIRELRNVIERLVIMTPASCIEAQDVHLFLGNTPGMVIEPPLVPAPSEACSAHALAGDVEAAHGAHIYADMSFKQAKLQFEKDYLHLQLEKYNGNVSKTAEHIGMERSHLHKKVKSLGIDVAEVKSGH